jgi:3-methyladenine DNA glycosylase AlkD
MESLAQLHQGIRALADPEVARFLQRFFKTGPGEYGHGDKFLGIRVPTLRALAKRALEKPRGGVSLHDAVALLSSEWHEERFVALTLMVHLYRRSTPEVREQIYRAYLAHTDRINNWDLVDSSAEHIVGAHDNPSKLAVLTTLARSDNLWERRIAMMATFYGIRRGEYSTALTIATLLLHDPHDLIHKAVGWMLREIGKRDPVQERAFLAKHFATMPRTMLRYAIERFPETERQAYLRGTTKD